MKKYGIDDYKCEGPLAMLGGGVIGGLLGGGGTLAGFLTTGGLIGSALGAVAGNILGKSLMPDMDFGSQLQQPQQPPASAVPQTPPAPAIPAAPATPGAVAAPGGGLGAPTATGPGGAASPVPVDISGPTPVPFNPGEAAPLTPADVSKGELNKKRKGRVSTILTTPTSRTGATKEEEEIEMLGG